MKPKINSYLNCINIHFWSKFGDSSLNGWHFIMQTNSKWDKFRLWRSRSITIKTIRILTVLRCISGPNLVILAWTGDKLSCRQAPNEVKFDFQVKFDLEGQGRSPPEIIRFLTKVFCTCTPNLVMLAWMSGELSRGQARDWYTHTRTQAGNDNTRRPKLASGKKVCIFNVIMCTE